MNKLNRILVLVLIFQLGLVLFFHLRGEDTTIGRYQPLIADLAKDKVERIRVFDRTARSDEGAATNKDEKKGKAGDHPAIDLVKKGDAWVLASHFDHPVETRKVTEFLDKLEDLRSRGPIASGKARQKQLEVADDSYQRKVVVTAGGKDVTLFLGASAGSRQTSARLAGHDDIHGVTGLTAFGVGAQPSAWVETAYIDVEADKVASFDVVNGKGSFHFERPASGGAWQVSVGGQPLAPRPGMEVNKSEIDKLVNRATKIYLSEPGDPKLAVDKPLATVTLHLKPSPPAGAGADAGAAAAESTMEEAGEDKVIEIAPSDKKDRNYLREKGRPTAALVDALSITDLVELSRDRLLQKPADKKKEARGASEPDDQPMEGAMPPGMDPDMMDQP